ncbi:MAG: methyltransferase domain-containing protein [Deltaproteobacteria bacterium]|nr:methyltransferase domain-containing protein [Deltaproteobacteria bacterium]
MTRRLFDLGARPYDVLTDQRPWRESCARLLDGLPGDGPLRVLDVGTGPGNSASAMALSQPDVEVVGVDVAERMLARARRAVARAGVSDRCALIRADAARLPFADASFKGITAHSVLYLVDDRDGFLSEVRRLLAPGGRAVFMEPRAGWQGRALLAALSNPRFFASMAGWRVMSAWKGRFDASSLEALLAGAGLRVESVEQNLDGLGLMAVTSRNR